MATMTRADSGNTTTYVITDMGGSTVTAVVTQTPVAGGTVTFASSGGLRSDGLSVLDNLVQALMTGLLPQASMPSF